MHYPAGLSAVAQRVIASTFAQNLPGGRYRPACIGVCRTGVMKRTCFLVASAVISEAMGTIKAAAHVWQGRFQIVPVQSDEHSLTCCVTWSEIRCVQTWSSGVRTGSGPV